MRRFFFSFIRRRVRRRRKATNVVAYRTRKEEARLAVHERVAYWQGVYPFVIGQVRIKNQRCAWGSCSVKNNLNFNWRLVTLPSELADYVILHELCHTVHFNHSVQFWGLLTSLMQEGLSHRSRLRQIRME